MEKVPHMISKKYVQSLFLLFSGNFDCRISSNNSDVDDQIKICDKFYEVYDLVKEKHGAPFKYISMVYLYIELYNEKAKHIATKQMKLQVKFTWFSLKMLNK